MSKLNVAIIGGGAGGFYAAIHVKENYPDTDVVILEKSSKLLAKVKISGGGRCNVTNGCESIKELAEAYPRGSKQLRKLFGRFNNHHVMEWFEKRGVALVTQDDGCVFPVSQNSQSIINCFLHEAGRLGVNIETNAKVNSIEKEGEKILLGFADESIREFDKVIVATGGSPKHAGLKWLEDLGHKITTPVPSLFTFNMPNESVKELMGVVVEEALTTVEGTKLKGDGPLLITHWGMSGPAILKLSAFGARDLFEKGYDFNLRVNWVNETNTEVVRGALDQLILENRNKQLSTIRPYYLPTRLWDFMIEKLGLNPKLTWAELGNKGKNKIIEVLTNDVYHVQGKTTFKEEFVTCGGVSLESINMKTMESKVIPGLYFTGEVIDVDGITGGYNFQAAWTTAFIAAELN